MTRTTNGAYSHGGRPNEAVELRAQMALALCQYQKSIRAGCDQAAAGRRLAREIEHRVVETYNRRG